MTVKMEHAMKSKFYWHIHHGVLLETATEPIKNRRTYIKDYKPEREQTLRLRLLKPVKGKLPAAIVKAYAAWDKAYAAIVKAYAARNKADAARNKADAARNKADAALDKAYAALDKAIDKNMSAILKLHEKECPSCPWNGRSIFPN